MSEVPKYISYDWNLTIPPKTVRGYYQDGEWGEELPPPPKNATHLRIEVTELSSGPERNRYDTRLMAREFRAVVEFTLYTGGGPYKSATFITTATHWLENDDDARAEFIRNWRLDHIAWLEESSNVSPDYETMSVEIVDRKDFLKWLGLDLAAIFKSATNEQQQPTEQPLRLTSPPPAGQ